MSILRVIVGLAMVAMPIVLAVKVRHAVGNYFLRRSTDKFVFDVLPTTEAGRALLKGIVDEKDSK